VQEQSADAPDLGHVAVSSLLNVVQTIHSTDFENTEPTMRIWATIAVDEIELAAVEPDPEVSAIEALNERIAGEIACGPASPEQVDAIEDDLDEITKNRIANFTRPTFGDDSRFYASGSDFAPAQRSYRGALVSSVTVAAAVVVSWIFVGWTPYWGSAEARRAETESVKPISATPAKPREITPSLSTLGLPTLSLRMRLAEPAQPRDDAAGGGEQKP